MNETSKRTEELFEASKELLAKLAKLHARGRSMSAEDLEAEGALGLLKAIEKFDPSRGAKFSTYASYWIKQAMLRALDEKSRSVRLPWQAAAKLRRIEEARARIVERTGRQPVAAELAKESGIPLKALFELESSCRAKASFDAPLAAREDGRERSLLDSLPDPSQGPFELLERKDSKAAFRKALASLDRREAQVISLRFGLGAKKTRPESCESVGSLIGLSREGVRKIQEKSLSKLRALLLPAFGGEAPEELAV